ncbi:hypothetical protein [Roseovarius sp. D0-M9]|uniref:hypothetical protein n=1 Tax=Roseovarius sp. D0-M9 TaxID=3127117 RepID=UPI0030102FD6
MFDAPDLQPLSYYLAMLLQFDLFASLLLFVVLWITIIRCPRVESGAFQQPLTLS